MTKLELQCQGSRQLSPYGIERQFYKLIDLPVELLELIFAKIAPSDFCSVACTNHAFRCLSESDIPWQKAFSFYFDDALADLLNLSSPSWWTEGSWKHRFAHLVSGAPFNAQVMHRELDNESEDFLLSAYDAKVALTVAPLRCKEVSNSPASQSQPLPSQRAEAPTEPPSTATPTSSTTACRMPITFSATYLPMGRQASVTESKVELTRIRAPPPTIHPWRVYDDGPVDVLSKLSLGSEVEVQWKGHMNHPFGWWFATVQDVQRNVATGLLHRVTLLFRQYPTSSIWRRVEMELGGISGSVTAVNGDRRLGYFGGIRVLNEEQAKQWQRWVPPVPLSTTTSQAHPEAGGGIVDISEADEVVVAEVDLYVEADVVEPAPANEPPLLRVQGDSDSGNSATIIVTNEIVGLHAALALMERAGGGAQGTPLFDG